MQVLHSRLREPSSDGDATVAWLPVERLVSSLRAPAVSQPIGMNELALYEVFARYHRVYLRKKDD